MKIIFRLIFRLLLSIVVFYTTQTFASVEQNVWQFCENFAKAVPQTLLKPGAATYVLGSAKIYHSKVDKARTILSNIFQPSDSQFIDNWQCYFLINQNAKTCQAEVRLPIAEHLAFAQYTAWKKLMIVKENIILDKNGKIFGYAVPKYYQLNCKN